MNFIDEIVDRAKAKHKTIVLPESYDVRVLKAAEEITKNGLAKIIVLGSPTQIRELASHENIDLSNVEILEPVSDKKFPSYVQNFFELRKEKGVSLEDAQKVLSAQDNLFYAGMMVRDGVADGCVAGADNTTGDVIRAAIQTVGMKDGIQRVSSSIFVVTSAEHLGEKGVFLMADVAVNPDPDARCLAEIAVSSAQTLESVMNTQAKVAMLSFSTKGSANHPDVEKVREATMLAKIIDPEITIDGELQIDPAIDPESARRKAPGSLVAGQANVLVFPDLGAANIGSKMPQVINGAKPIGPLIQGVAKPFNDLSRSCTMEDIVVVVAMTCLQAD